MRSILSSDGRAVLEDLAAHQALLAFDFDGTLAPIVAARDAASVPPGTLALLRVLAILYPCAIISGRARADVAARVSRVPLIAVIGNLGAEAGFGPVNRSGRRKLVAWKRRLKAELSFVPGIDVEDKGFSLAVHYRQVPSWAAARHLSLRAASALEGARVSGGHAVIHVAPADAPDKGAAIGDLLRRIGPRPVLYVGDDRSDEEVFRSPLVDVGVRVGRTARSAARWYLPAQVAVDELLRTLLAARTRRDGRGDRWEGFARAVSS
jgi:trehalose 6-phosphate phosphatase